MDSDYLKRSEFSGFIKISDLKANASSIPKLQGVYVILRPQNRAVDFVETGTGGFFKDKDPNVDIGVLKKHWIEEAQIIFIGKAGGTDKKATLHARLKQYLRFGQGEKIGHYGGRYVWQIKDIDDYVMCWKELPDNDPRAVEKELLELFRQKYDNLPFANLQS